MHRSRLALPVILTTMAACSTRSNNSESAQVLAQDTSLAHLDLRRNATLVALPEACGSVASAAAPTDDGRREAGGCGGETHGSPLDENGSAAPARTAEPQGLSHAVGRGQCRPPPYG